MLSNGDSCRGNAVYAGDRAHGCDAAIVMGKAVAGGAMGINFAVTLCTVRAVVTSVVAEVVMCAVMRHCAGTRRNGAVGKGVSAGSFGFLGVCSCGSRVHVGASGSPVSRCAGAEGNN